METLCSLKGVTHHYEDPHPVLHDVNVSVPPQSWIHVEGENGAGKTTLLKIVAGALKPQQGSIERQCTLSQIGSLFHRPGVHPHWTVEDTVEFWRRQSGATIEGVRTALDILELRGRRMEVASQLSSGWLRRLAFTRVLMKPRELYVLDEPWNFLDTSVRQKIAEVLQGRVELGAGVVIAAHEEQDGHCTQRWQLSSGAVTCR